MYTVIAQSALEIAHGQQMDLACTNQSALPPDTIINHVRKKTGMRRALYARLAGLLCGFNSEQMTGMDRFSQNLGIARQIGSDVHDLMEESVSRDVMNGTKTWPIVWALREYEGEHQAQIAAKCKLVRDEESPLEELRELLTKSGLQLRCGLEIESYVRQAKADLIGIGLSTDATALMEAFLHDKRALRLAA